MTNHDLRSEDLFPKELNLQLDGLTPTYRKWRVVKVHFSEPVLVRDYAELLSERLAFSVSVKRSFDPEELVEYFTTLVALRISYVNNARFIDAERTLDRRMYNDSVTVPDIINVILNQVGRVVDQELGYEVIPVMDKTPLLEPKRFNQLSIELRDLRALGVAYSMVLPRDRQGDPLFMTLQLADNVVVGSDPKVHPTQVFLGAFFKATQEDAVIQPLLDFAEVSSLRRIIGNVVR